LRGRESRAAPEECVMPTCPRPGAGIPELTARVARAATPAPGTREAGLGKGRARGAGFTV